MDLQYLLFLQDIRESMGPAIPEFMLALTKFAVSAWPLLILAFIYWVIDRKAGRRLFGAFSLSMLLNGFLKATFCVYRPWIRDPRIEPYGDAKVSASGYSFPSGHTMYATPTIGGIGVWQWAKHRWISIICFIYVLLVMFSRNFLGCHTPQDVIVGAIAGFFCIFLIDRIEAWIDGKTGRDNIAIIIAVVLCIILGVYYLTKSYPMDYTADGKLIADPYPLVSDCFEGLGTTIGFFIARKIEKNGFDFENEMHWKDRFIIAIFACIPIYFWRASLYPLIKENALYLAKFLNYSIELFYVLAIVPWIMGKIHKSGILNKDKLN